MKNLEQRVSAKVVVESEGGLLVLHPSGIDTNRKWHIPGGIRDDIYEPLEDTGARELEEETGIVLDKPLGRVIKCGEWEAVDQGEDVKILAIFFHIVLPRRPIISLSLEHDDKAWLDRSNYRDYDVNREVKELVEQLL